MTHKKHTVKPKIFGAVDERLDRLKSRLDKSEFGIHIHMRRIEVLEDQGRIISIKRITSEVAQFLRCFFRALPRSSET